MFDLPFVYCVLLALQFGFQPILNEAFTPPGVCKSSVVIATEISKILIAVIAIGVFENDPKTKSVWKGWTLSNSFRYALIPAALYAIQNLCVVYTTSGQLLDSMTFNLLNQTKTLSAAFFCFWLLGQKQSAVQMFALLLMFLAACILQVKFDSIEEFMIEFGRIKSSFPLLSSLVSSSSSSYKSSSSSFLESLYKIEGYKLGLLLTILASLFSGLSGALTQLAMTPKNGSYTRHSIFFSAEMAVYQILYLLMNLYNSGEKELLISGALFKNWTVWLLIPVICNAFGGVVVGLVTKHCGGVVKGFALIAGLVLTGFAQWVLKGTALHLNSWIAVVLVSVSIVLHSKFPIPKTKSVPSQEGTESKKVK